jgi:hypothetical protein
VLVEDLRAHRDEVGVGHRCGALGAPAGLFSQPSGILEVMTKPVGPRRHLASSPFKPDPEPTIEQYAVDDRVVHDAYGLGRVISVEAAAVTVDFSSQTVRITSPFTKMSRL